MSRTDEHDAVWVQAIEDAETILTDAIRGFSHDEIVEYLDDLLKWADDFRLRTVTRSARILNANGYNKSEIARTLGTSRQTLMRVLASAEMSTRPVLRLADRVPGEFIDISEQFDAMPKQ